MNRTNPDTDAFLGCLDKAQCETRPYRHWLLRDVLSEESGERILDLPRATPAPTSSTSG